MAPTLPTAQVAAPAWWQLRRRAAQSIARMSARRRPREKGPVNIHRRRIYIVPTRMGFIFGFLVLMMLLGSMNYMNSLAFVLTFLLASMGLVTMHHTHRNLLNLSISSGQHNAVFAGQDAIYKIHLDNASATERYSLAVHWVEDDPVELLDVAGHRRCTAELSLPTSNRGRLPAPRFTIHTTFPLGLFYAWCHVELDMHCLVYPTPADNRLQAPPTRGDKGGKHHENRGQEDFAGLRDYQRNDSPGLIHWKAYPRNRQLVVKQFSDPQSDTLWLDWASLEGLDTEKRLSQLCRWVLDAHRCGRHYGLRLPDQEIAPACDENHRHHCLEQLALFDG